MAYTTGPSEQKEVIFGDYCKKCVYRELGEHEEPCNECLTNTVNWYSHKPVMFKEDKNVAEG